jgi:hypothetical protein
MLCELVTLGGGVREGLAVFYGKGFGMIKWLYYKIPYRYRNCWLVNLHMLPYAIRCVWIAPWGNKRDVFWWAVRLDK